MCFKCMEVSLLTLLLWVIFPAQAQPPTLPQLAQLGNGTAEALDWHPTEDFLAVGGSLGLRLYDRDLNELAHLPEISKIYRLTWSPDGTLLATVTSSGTLQIWDVTPDLFKISLRYTWTFEDQLPAHAIIEWSPQKREWKHSPSQFPVT